MVAIIERMSSPLISDTAFWATCAQALCHALHQLVQQQVLPRFEHAQIVHKADGSLLSDADTAVQQALPEILSAIYPAPFLGEEMPAAEQTTLWQSSQAQDSPLWIADPIDGTTNFAHGLPWFATSVALVCRGQTLLGVTVAPALNRIWHASLGGGSFCNNAALQLPTSPKCLKDCVVGVDMTYLPASLASGQIDAYIHGGQMPWDAAAGRLILAEAGGYSAPLNDVLGHQSTTIATLRPTGYAAAAPSIWPLWQDWLGQSIQ